MPVFGASLVYVTSVMPLHASTSWYHKYWRDDDNEINFLKNRLNSYSRVCFYFLI